MPIPPSNRAAGQAGHVGDHNSLSTELTAVKATADAAIPASEGRAAKVQATAPISPAVDQLWVDTANDNLLKRWDGAAWKQAGMGTYVSGARGTTLNAWAAATISNKFVGYDDVAGAVYAINQNAGTLVRSTNGGTTWTGSLALPAGVTWSQVWRVFRFGAHIYLASAGTPAKLWRADPAALAWVEVLSLVSGGGWFGMTLEKDADYIYAAEYNDPVGGPALYRSADGTTWTTLWRRPGWRHVHSVVRDPDTGNIYVNGGDGVSPNIGRSTDQGDTWVWASGPQVVQLAVGRDGVYGTGDGSGVYLSVVRFEKDLSSWESISSNFHANMAPYNAPAGQGVFFGSWAAPGRTITTLLNTFSTTKDVGAAVRAPGLPAGSKIASVQSVTQATLDRDPTGSAIDGPFVLERPMLTLSSSPFFIAVDRDNDDAIYFAAGSSTDYPVSFMFFLPRHGGPSYPLDQVYAPGSAFGYTEIIGGVLWSGATRRPLIDLA